MPRPLWNTLWLKLFGPDGPTTIAGLRDAILSAQFGQGVGDGSFIARFQAAVAAKTNVPERPDPRGADGNSDPRDHGQDGSLVELRLPVIPGAVMDEHSPFSIFGIDVAPAGSATPAPENAATSVGRVVTLLVAADPAIALGLVPIEYGPANGEGPFHDATRDNPFGNGWLANWLIQQQVPMRVDWDADSLGSAATDLGLLLGPVLGTIELAGDFSAGFMLARPSLDIEQLNLAAGHDYNLILDADYVAAGRSLVINGQPLGAGDHVAVDGSAAAGSLTFFGGAGDDRFFGGAGNDLIHGLGGADTLAGGGGSDTFVYRSASDSTGAAYDILADFNPAQDKIDLPVTVTGFDAAVLGGALSTASFNADLGAALAGLGAGHAVVYAPDTGDLAGNVFLVVDANGIAGYQEGEDYVFALPATSLADLTAHPGFFI